MSQKEKNKTPPELDDQLEEAAAKEAAEEPAEAEAGAPDPLMDELEAYDEAGEDLIAWFWDKYQEQEKQ